MARARGPVEPSSGGQWGMHDPTAGLVGVLVGTGWLAVTVCGIRLGVRHHELRAETAGENPQNPARRWPLPRHG